VHLESDLLDKLPQSVYLLHKMKPRIYMKQLSNRIHFLIAILIALMALGASPTAHAQTPEWVEPRGVGIVDLIGVVAEAHLQGSIVIFHPGTGMAIYESGTRVGNTVTLTVRYEANPLNIFFCPTAIGNRDHWPTAVPASTMRVFSGSVDITSQVNPIYLLYPARQTTPSADSTAPERYPRVRSNKVVNSSGAIETPANMGCYYYFEESVTDLRATFTFETPQYIQATYLGSDSDTFRSYIGPGAPGFLGSLQSQMQSRFGDRHDDLDINPPAGTEFVLFHYPPTPVDPYGDVNFRSPGAGTYRIRKPNGKLSVDHFGTFGIPFYGQFQDSDQSSGREFLPFFSDGVRVSSPEYFVPEGIQYDPCMTNGGCSAALLDRIYDVVMSATVYYYRFERIRGGLTQIPLRQVGPSWSPRVVSAGTRTLSAGAEFERRVVAIQSSLDMSVYLPAMFYQELLPADDPTNCPCGWFDADLRMVDFVPGP